MAAYAAYCTYNWLFMINTGGVVILRGEACTQQSFISGIMMIMISVCLVPYGFSALLLWLRLTIEEVVA